MNNSSTELKVGIFAILVILILTYMTFKVGGLPLIWEKGYRLYVEFDDINGLDEQSRIKVAGVEAGIVEKIRLEEGKARLTLLINPEVKMYRNAKAFLRMSGLLGDRHLSLSPGTPDQPLLNNGDTIIHSIPAADIDMLANRLTAASTNISELTDDLKSILGEGEKEAIKESINNLRVFTENLKEISVENRAPLQRIIAQLDNFTGLLDERGPELVENLSETARELKEVIGENRYALKSSIENIRSVSESANNIGQRLERGEGTLGKLIKDDELYDSLNQVSVEAGKALSVAGRLRTFMDFHAEYDTNESDFKGFFDLTLQPKEDKYYILGVVTDPRGSVTTTHTTIDGVTTTVEEVESKFEFSAQFAKRFNDLVLRIGLMENTFGLGADYFFNSDNGRVRFDMWDFSVKEADADKSHARIGIDYRLFKFMFVSVGVDNLLNSNRRGIYVGGGVKFEDEDFKYIFGKSPNISLP